MRGEEEGGGEKRNRGEEERGEGKNWERKESRRD